MLVNALLLAETSTSRNDPAAAGVPTQLIALLDDTHLAQLVRTPSRLRYDPDFQIAGSDLRIDPPTVLCKPCRAIMKDPPIVKTKDREYCPTRYERRFLRNLPAPENWQAHHSSIFELVDCCSILDGGCHLCQLLWYEFKAILDNIRQDSAKFSLKWPTHMLEVCMVNHLSQNNTCIWTNLIFQSRDVLDPAVRGIYLLFTNKPWQHPEDEASVLLSSTSTESKETFAKIASWIRECTQQHVACRQQPGLAHERPTRLVAIDSSGTKFRLEKSPKNTEYLALSYRWGRSDRALMLTSETIEKFTEWAPTSILSKTIQDACSIVNRVGLRYLWVDRLCIIQDSPDDWSHEASRMAHIYKQAFCTISADGAPDEHGGCFMKRSALGIQGLKLISSPLGDRSGYLLNSERDPYSRRRGGYLTKRGWVFQERMLSHRILRFGRHLVYWECNERLRDEVSQESYYYRDRLDGLDAAAIENNGKLDSWVAAVQLYTECDLTFERDKLPALSGVAQEMHQIAPDDYLAGMWRQSFIQELCWVTERPASTLPETYRAPSWSWASHSVSVLNYWGGVRTPMAALSFASIKLASRNPFGEVQDGWILLSCHLNTISLKASTEELDSTKIINVEFQKEDERAPSSNFESHCWVKLDFSASLLKEWATRMYSLPLYHDHMYINILLLVPHDTFGPINPGATLIAPRTQDGREYRRVGMIDAYNGPRDQSLLKWLEESPKKNVVIR